MSSITLRHASPEDIPTILGFIKDLAEYEKEPDAVKATPELLKENLFEKNHARVLLAEESDSSQTESKTPIGMALYFFTFSTWTAKPSLYLEDLYVSSEKRNKGVGKVLFAGLGQVAKAKGCARMDWSVLDWNEPSIAFYTKTLGAKKMEGWSTMRLEEEGIEKLGSLTSTPLPSIL
ncbi:acyl-CoA N-acyltransferase [Violaceomyces palustris]|uniref:Acyl-CoA N-acyltransferase n=1 Tax=Violaceomyces palustris TaxID=1673888 RepID=A0ACD0P1E4_9BASI|nr:acyl-CoA N-acyltransferase [Violaceomyces palustris]